VFKLSPSDFAYLYEECKHCFVLKVKYGNRRPSSPMPGVFGAINTRLQGGLVGHDLRTLSANMPEGFVESQEGWLESTTVPGTSIYLKGKYDLLVRQPDNTYMVIDFKISQPSDEKAAKYKTQLQTYKFALEHPKSGNPLMVTKMGLILVYPDLVKYENNQAVVDFPATWVEIPQEMESFYEFMRQLDQLLTGPMPPENPECQWCKYRHQGEKALNEAAAEDIPF
jgi:hypothetical protein